MSFWDKLFANERKVIGLSPMDGVTDAPMRYMVAKYGRPSVMFTEFVSVDALAHAKEPIAVGRILSAFIRARDVGNNNLDQEKSNENTYPFEVAQVFGHDPELFYQAGVIVATLGFDGIDINMGCPAHKVEEHGSGAGLIRTPDIAKQIVLACRRGVEDVSLGKINVNDLPISVAIKDWVNLRGRTPKEAIPVSVKTRIGIDKNQVEEWIPEIMSVAPAVLSLHGRTLKQLYQGKADWSVIKRAGEIVHQMGGRILGNGDITSHEDAIKKITEHNLDGILIGRGAEGNPGIFTQDEPDFETKLEWMLEHAKVYERMIDPMLPEESRLRMFVPVRKHLAWYANGFPGASEMRSSLVHCSNVAEVGKIIEKFTR